VYSTNSVTERSHLIRYNSNNLTIFNTIYPAVMATMLKRVQICTTQRQVGSWMYNKEKNLCSSQN